MIGATDYPGGDLVENVISQGGLVSALVRSTSDAPRLERLGIDVVRSHVSDKIMTITKAQQEQGFVPKVSLSDGVRDTIAWHSERGLVVTTRTIRTEIWNARS
jgi:nucleoside-diphosphate-sugar epimerase